MYSVWILDLWFPPRIIFYSSAPAHVYPKIFETSFNHQKYSPVQFITPSVRLKIQKTKAFRRLFFTTWNSALKIYFMFVCTILSPLTQQVFFVHLMKLWLPPNESTRIILQRANNNTARLRPTIYSSRPSSTHHRTRVGRAWGWILIPVSIPWPSHQLGIIYIRILMETVEIIMIKWKSPSPLHTNQPPHIDPSACLSSIRTTVPSITVAKVIILLLLLVPRKRVAQQIGSRAPR